MKVFVVQRVLRLADATAHIVHVATFDNQADANRTAVELQDAMAELLRAQLVTVEGQQAHEVGLSAGQFMADLGVATFNHFVKAIDVQSPILQAPAPSIILSS